MGRTLWIGIPLLALALPGPAQEPAKATRPVREVLADYLRTADKAARKRLLDEEIAPRGEKAVPDLQQIMDLLAPLYRQARDERNQLQRQKKDPEEIPADQVDSWVDSVVRKSMKPDPGLGRAGAMARLRAALGDLMGIRTVLVRPILVSFLQEQLAAGVSFPGQYKPLQERLGRAAMAVLLQMATDRQGLEEEVVRLAAARALADVAEPEPPLLSDLRKVSADDHESRELRLAVAVTLARLGDREPMAPFFAAALAQAERPNAKAKAKGLRELAQLWHQVGEPGKAVEYYTRLLEVMAGLVDPEDRTQQIFFGADHYSRACSYALLGKVEEALADLRKAVALKGVTAGTLKADKELDPLRRHPEFEKIAAEAPSRLR